MDRAGLLEGNARARLDAKLAAHEARTGNQIAILVIPALEGEALEDFSLKVAEAWKLGPRHSDKGILLLIAAAERRARIEVGYGLEGDVTDAHASRIIRGILAPAFAAQDFEGGLERTATALMQLAGGEPVDVPSVDQGPRSRRAPPWATVLVMVIFVLVSLLSGRHRAPWWMLLLGGGRGGSWGGRSSGGFSGGGGRFGGGGASGGW